MPFCHEHSTEEEEEEAAQEENVELPEIEKEKRQGAVRHRQRLGESIVGDRRETSPYEVSYGDSVEWRLLCNKQLTSKDLVALKEAIHNEYFFEMFVEDLPMWGYIGDTADEDLIVGETEGSKTYLFTHLHFHLGQNRNQIVTAKVTTDVRTYLELAGICTSSVSNSRCLVDGTKSRHNRCHNSKNSAILILCGMVR